MTLRATLVTDGTSDVVLLPVLQWLMRQLTRVDFEIRWADRVYQLEADTRTALEQLGVPVATTT